MDELKELIEQIEQEHAVAFSYNESTGRIRTEGKPADVDAAIDRLSAYPREQLADVLRARLPIADETRITRELSIERTPSLAVQRANYVNWFSQKSKMYHRTDEELDRMFALCEEGDEILPDFAYSFTVRKPNGLLIMVNKEGEIENPSPYSPHQPRPPKAE